MLKSNIFYQFILNYLDENENSIKSKYKTLDEFKNNFSFSYKDIHDFIDFAESKGVKYSKKDFDKDENYIIARLKAQIARNYWKNKGWFEEILSVDNQLLKAVTLFGEAKELAELK